MSAQSQVTEPVVVCPKCQNVIPLTKALTGPIESQVARRLEAQYQARERAALDNYQSKLADATKRAAAKVRAAQAAEFTALNEQLAEQRETIGKLQRTELDLRKHSREVEAREKALKLEIERKVDERCKAIEEETTARLQEHHRLKDMEKDKQLADLRHQLEDMSRKVQQGSQQVQGEVAEEDLESELRQLFPQDRIEPVSNGLRGADILHRVVDGRGEVVGTIVYEVKNTKAFSEAWLSKLREDQRALGAEVALLISGVLPKDVRVFAQRQGVWVAGYDTWMPLVHALRVGILNVARARVVAEGQADKQQALIAYCGGTEFRQRIEAMVDPVIALIEDLERERRAFEGAWARRKKRHEQLVQAIAGMYGDVSGLLGTLPRLPQLELQPGEPDTKAA